MSAGAALVVLLSAIAIVAVQLRSALGGLRGALVALAILLIFGGAGGLLEWNQRHETPLPDDMTSMPPTSSQTCFKCHESHFTSWHQSYHRTMTRDATPENVKADFNDAVFEYMGVTSRMSRRGDRFYMETVDPAWEAQLAQHKIPLDRAGPIRLREFSVDRVVGSHWFQQLMHRDGQGRYLRLPLAYHLVEKRWVHLNGAFLTPPADAFFGHTSVWNETCLYCHNTRVVKNPVPIPGRPRGYQTEVGELGISCEACHGAAERHVEAHRNPAKRLAQRYAVAADPTIINPARVSVERADDICAHCHGGVTARYHEWNRTSEADPFLAGRELSRFWYRPYSEFEGLLRTQGIDDLTTRPERPNPLDGRFWRDGTPLTTALEYQGMSLSACYQDGHGKLSCLSCHSMHQSAPDHQMKPEMQTNAACYGCHEGYRTKLVEHTHHAAGSEGSLCYNCHMPYQVYSLLDTHRSHRIAVPRIRDSLSTGKPHACNLCHLDKSLGWTQEQLAKWYGTKPETLSDDEKTLASSVLHLAGSDARTRAVVAGAFSWPPAQKASGTDWETPLLLRALEQERYEAVRYSMHRALRSLHGNAAADYNYEDSPANRAAQLKRLRATLAGQAPLARKRYPYLPQTSEGLFDDEPFDRLFRTRKDPDVFIHE